MKQKEFRAYWNGKEMKQKPKQTEIHKKYIVAKIGNTLKILKRDEK